MQKISTALLSLFLSIFLLKAQPALQLRTARLQLLPPAAINVDAFYKQQTPIDGKRFVIVQFSGPLSAPQKEKLSASGIQLLSYLPPYAYTATFQNTIAKTNLQQAGIIGMGYMPGAAKISNTLQQPGRYNWLQGNNGLINVLVKVAGIGSAKASQLLQQQQFTVSSSAFQQYAILQVRLAASQIAQLAENPFVEWIEPVHPEDKPLNNITTTTSGAKVANASVANGGYGLDGSGVTAGVGDDGNASNHIDLVDRVVDRSGFLYNYHDTHVSGTVGGAGISRYLSRGYAPAVKIISQLFSGIWLNAAQYINDFGMVVTNNSYGNIASDPTYEGVYDLYSNVLDQQAFQFPELLNVFASGNDGFVAVPPYPAHYGTVLSGYQSAKNVMTVGRTDQRMYVSATSSSGPVQDGRLKPEILAVGEAIISPIPDGYYGTAWGTSMAAPAITGGTVLLTEQYRKQFGGANPKSALVKTLLMNGSTDLGAKGIDFLHGYGIMNLQRSLDMLKNNHYYTNSIATNGIQIQTIAVPANTGQLKVMLYWHDPAASLYATRTLVNDLDVEVVDPQGNVVLPQKLDTTAAGVTNIAITGVDHTNNSEQVIINQPVAGNYTIRVKGFAVNVNPNQTYYVAYDFLPTGLQLYAPFTGEAYFPGEQMVIHWTDNATPSNQRTLEYSTDDGTTWNLIANNISDTLRLYTWDIPPTISTTQARIRITENNTSFSNISGRFILLGAVNHSFADASQQCEGYCRINWAAVPGITDYEVLMKKGIDMQPVGTTTNTTYTVSGLSKDSVYWFSVRPRLNGIAGKRSDGQSYQPNGGSCAGTISDGDLQLDAILNPNTGRRFSSSELTSNTTISIRIKNLDDASISTYDVKYAINGGAFTTQRITAPIAAGSTAVFNFTGVNLSAEGTYTITAVVKNVAADGVSKNDTLIKVVKQLANNPISLTTAFVENFETADSASYDNTTAGLNGLDRWDFAPMTGNGDRYGRVRTFVNSGVANGNRAVTVDVRKFVDNTNLGSSQLHGTFNLSNYNAATDEVRFDFLFKQHGSFQQDATLGKNEVLIKGSESESPQLIYNLTANQPAAAGQWKRSESLEISDVLALANQSFSPTTQITFTQTSSLGMGDNTHLAGYTFDDVRLYTVSNDIQVIAIDSPSVNNCSLGSVRVKAKVKNSMSYAINNIPVKLQINGSLIATETITAIPANTTITYTFNTTANVSNTGNHVVAVWADLPADNFRENDTLRKTITNQPVISTFPYLEDFESTNGNFYTGGTNSSWLYGTPNGMKIRTAASGIKAWKTGLQSSYNDEEFSYLYTPCFNTSSLAQPMLSFAMAYDIEYCRPTPCDGAWMEYSTDGENWSKLGTAGTGTNWYNNGTYQIWDSTKLHWHVASVPLPTGVQNLRLRFVISSDLFTGKDGVAIDDIHIFDRVVPIYDSSNSSNVITQNVNGNNRINFTANNKVVAALQANNNALGNTGVKAWMYNGPVRNTATNYYANRNLTVQPLVTNTSAPVTVRFYFLDGEADSLRFARGCATCKVPKDYTYIGILKYNDNDDTKENGTMADNQTGTYAFYNSAVVRKIPYDKGYYAEVGINSFSELWLTDGTPPNNPLPIQWLSFTAEKRGANNVLLQWTMENEDHALQYEIEVMAPGSSQFVKIASIMAVNQQPQSRYMYTDSTIHRKGVYQYRIKRTDRNGQTSYSEVRMLIFGNDQLNVVVYPNPVIHTAQVVLQSTANTNVQLQLYDITGKLLLQQQTLATGTAQKVQLNMGTLPAGMYQLQVKTENATESFKIIKAD